MISNIKKVLKNQSELLKFISPALYQLHDNPSELSTNPTLAINLPSTANLEERSFAMQFDPDGFYYMDGLFIGTDFEMPPGQDTRDCVLNMVMSTNERRFMVVPIDLRTIASPLTYQKFALAGSKYWTLNPSMEFEYLFNPEQWLNFRIYTQNLNNALPAAIDRHIQIIARGYVFKKEIISFF